MRVFWDTNLFIYLWEEGPWSEDLRQVRGLMRERHAEWVTSALTVGEIVVHPLRKKDAAQAERYRDAFRSIEVVSFDEAAAFRFAAIRAGHPRVRPPDAIQLACAAASGCDWFLTHDRRLRGLQVDGLGQVASYRDFALVK